MPYYAAYPVEDHALTLKSCNNSGNYMALVRCRKNSHSLIVSFGNDTTVKLAYRLKAALLRLLEEPVVHYRFDLSEIIDTDITFIQLLISFSRTISKDERRLSVINCTADSVFMKTCDLCGIDIRSILEFEG
jgi:anti-anti-sigma regulatory factor